MFVKVGRNLLLDVVTKLYALMVGLMEGEQCIGSIVPETSLLIFMHAKRRGRIYLER